MHLLLIVVAVTAVFGSSLGNGFVWDDRVYLIGRDVYRHFDLKQMFLSLGNGVEYLPLRDLTYAFDYLFWGERAAGFHLTSLLLHCGAALAAYGTTVRLVPLLTGKGQDENVAAVALLTALAFALHPLQSQAVYFIICRNVVLSGLFFFLACRFFIDALTADSGWRLPYAAALCSFLAALLSKGTTIMLPLLLLLISAHAAGRPVRWKALALAPFFALSVLFYFVFKGVASHTTVIADSASFPGTAAMGAKVAVALQIPFFYLKKFLLPQGFAAEYEVPFAGSFSDPAVLLTALGLAAGCAFLFLLRKRRPELPFGALWYLLALLPVLNFFNTIPVVADRYAYLPLYGVCFAVSSLVRIPQSVTARNAIAAAAAVLIVAWGGISFGRSAVWKSDRALWEDALQVSPGLAKAAINLGEVYFRDKEYDKALSVVEFTRTDVAANDYYDLYRGLIASEKGELTVAANSFTKALERNGQFLGALFYLGMVNERLGNIDAAIDCFNRVVLSPELETGNFRERSRAALQGLYARMAPELARMRETVDSHPEDLRVRGELALRLDALGLYDEALRQYRVMADRGMPGWQLPFNIAGILQKQRKYPEALAAYQQSAAIHPTAATWNNIGWLQIELGKYDGAAASFQRALALDPSFGYAAFNLGRAYFHKGDRENTLRIFTTVRQQFPELAPKAAEYLKQIH